MTKTDNDKCVDRSRMLIIQDKRQSELTKNHRENSSTFYAETMFAAIAIIRSMTHLPYRQFAGMME